MLVENFKKNYYSEKEFEDGYLMTSTIEYFEEGQHEIRQVPHLMTPMVLVGSKEHVSSLPVKPEHLYFRHAGDTFEYSEHEKRITKMVSFAKRKI